MCNTNCLAFSIRNLKREDIEGKKVLEVGAYDVNGSAQSVLKSWNPLSYVGTDIEQGPGVDVVCDAGELVERFGKGSFDTVLSNEMLEHVKDWRRVISNIKNVTKPNGTILLTTRSLGFNYHAYPYDFWRYEIEDMKEIFSDCEILVLESDMQEPGVLIKVRKPASFTENDLSRYKLYSIIADRRITNVAENDTRTFYFRKTVLKYKIKNWVLRAGKSMYQKV